MSLITDISREMTVTAPSITIHTCAITSINNDGLCCPIGCGLGVNMMTKIMGKMLDDKSV